MSRIRNVAATLALGIMLAACSGGGQDGGDPPSTSAVFNAPEWTSAGEASVAGSGTSAQMSLSGGEGRALFPDLSVGAGDVVEGRFVAAGPAGRTLRVVLIRHCDPENGEGAASEVFTLSAEPTPFIVRHTFESAHSCIRVSFMSGDGQPLEVAISELSLARN